MTRQQLFALFFFVVLIFLLYQFYLMFHVFLVPLTWAGMLALIFYPVQAKLTDLLRGRVGLASFLLTTVVILVVMVPTVLISILLANESAALYERTKEFLTSDEPQQVMERLQAYVPASLQSVLQTSSFDVASLAGTGANAVSAFLVSQVAGIAKNIASFLANFFLTTFALFFFFRDGARMVRWFRDVLPMEPAHKELLLTRFYDTVSAVVQGTLVTAAAQGLLAGIGYWVVGAPFSLIFGCATALMSLIPMGPPVVWGGLAIYLAVTGSVGRAVILALWGALVVSAVDNFLKPLIIGNRTDIPTILLFFGILGGLQAYGFLGVFLAPAVIAILVAVVRIYREQYATAG